MRRVLVIGSPGSGKSTLATELARRTGLPLVHLDQEHWRSGWIEPPKDEWRRRVAELVAGDRWIIDGNYGGTLDLRLARADTLIDLEFPAWLCVWRILLRVASSWGRVRPDMAQGCPEQLNFEFLVYTAMFPFTARKRTEAKLKRFTGTRVHLTSPAEVRRFLASLDPSG
jgi:adenylate kinase family enzyme